MEFDIGVRAVICSIQHRQPGVLPTGVFDVPGSVWTFHERVVLFRDVQVGKAACGAGSG
jgi:hypothetical protein